MTAGVGENLGLLADVIAVGGNTKSEAATRGKERRRHRGLETRYIELLKQGPLMHRAETRHPCKINTSTGTTRPISGETILSEQFPIHRRQAHFPLL